MRDDVNLADLLEALADVVGERDAVIQGDRRVSWSEFDRRAWGVATSLLDAGLGRGERVALYLRNCSEYLEGHIGALKASLVPVNTNYRYVDDELVHLWNDADAAAVIFHGGFAEVVERIRGRVPLVRSWLWVDDGSGPCPTWAQPYEEALLGPRREPPWPRSYDDLVFIYTGGTTGLPKGVMWDQDVYLRPIRSETGDLGSLAARRGAGIQRIALPAAPLMHGTGVATALGTLIEAGTVVLLPSARFDPAELWSEVERHGVGSVTIVGDAFARPMADALDAGPDRWQLGCLRSVVSAGAMFSAPAKARLLDHLPHLVLRDQLGSSENALSGMRVSRGAADGTGTFDLAPGVRVLDDDGRDVEPGSGQVGVLAAPGGAVGYHKDPEKTARTWKVIDGQRYTVAGDYATVDADGTLRLLGRGSVCINTGGEKVYPEEVEEALKTHHAVDDAVVVGVPDDRFGERVAAVVQLRADVSDEELSSHLADQLARYKLPRHVVRVDSVGRAVNGKADYAGARQRVQDDIEGRRVCRPQGISGE